MKSRPQLQVAPPGDRLDSWKEIAAHLGRSERTVRRWEQAEQLPVHRHAHEKRGSVYAFRWELDEWRASRSQLLSEVPEAVEPEVPQPAARRGWTWWVLAGTLLIVAAGVFAIPLMRAKRPAPELPLASVKPEAMQAFRRGTAFAADLSTKSVEAGIRNLQEAIRLEPRFNPAYVTLSSAYVASSWFSERPGSQVYAEARELAQRSLELAPKGGAWRVLALTTHYLDWDHATAETYLKKAVELHPKDAVAHNWYSAFLIDSGRYQDAEARIRQAREQAPAWLESDTTLGDIRLLLGDADGAISEYRRVLEGQPHYGIAHVFLGRVYAIRGEFETALSELRTGNDLLGRPPFSTADLGYALAKAGKTEEAREILAAMTRRRGEAYYPAFAIAELELGLGETETALEWLERASGERLFGWYMPKGDILWKPASEHPRFQALMRKMNFR